MKLNSRNVAVVLLTVTLVAVGGYLLLRPDRSDDRLTVVSWGGSTQEGLDRTILQPFQRQTGTTVLQDTYNGELELIRQMVAAGDVRWDVVHVEDDMLYRAASQGLLERLPDEFLNDLPLRPDARHPYGVAFFSWGTVLAYNNTRLRSLGLPAPEDWSSLWDPRYPGPIGMRRSPIGTIEIALLANGVPPDSLYPLDREKVETALGHLDRIRSKIAWWEGGAEHQQKLLTEYVLSAAWSGRVWVMVQAGEDVGMTLNGALARYDWWVLPKGTPHRDAALRYLQFASRAAIQRSFDLHTGYGPSNPATLDSLPQGFLALQPAVALQQGKAVVLDGRWWAENLPWVEERWQQWLGQ